MSQHLDPEKRHTVLQFMDAGIKLDRVKTDMEGALEWARKNKVDLSVPGGKEALINSARLQRNLPLFDFMPSKPPQPVATEPVTRDGHPSTAAAVIAHTDRPGDVEMSVALNWAKLNRLVWDRTSVFIDQINEERHRLKLPKFRIKPSAGAVTKVAPGQIALDAERASVSSSPRPIASTIPGPDGPAPVWTALPTSERELFDMATSFNGLVSGPVTPELAGWLLNLNSGNRPLNRKSVERFTDMLKDGKWKLTGEPVIVSSEAILNDGQHRLHGIVRSGIAADLDIRFGVAREAFSVTGTGSRRTPGHAMAIAGRQYPQVQAAIARVIIHYDHGDMGQVTQAVEPDDVLRLTDEEPMIGEVASMMRSFKFGPNKNALFCFVLVVAARSVPFEKVKEFASLVDDGRADDGCATRRLHIKLRDAKFAHFRWKPVDLAVLSVHAWNNWIACKATRTLVVKDTDRLNASFPQIASQ